MTEPQITVDNKPELCAVFGATGMLGTALVNQLLERGKRVRAFDLQLISDDRVEQIQGDIRNPQDVRKAVEDADTVFQTVAIIDWNPREPDSLYDVNVHGNRNVIEACIEAGVKKLIYTSSMDVVFGGHPLYYADESTPYPKRYLDHYSHSKAVGEQEVIAANGRGRLLTCSIRATGIYGPGDNVRFPAVINALRAGNPPRMGDGSARVSNVYVENCAYAHVLAAETLEKGSVLEGQCYFITDHEPANFYDFVYDDVCKKLGYQVSEKRIPYWFAKMIAQISEFRAKATRSKKAPLITNYVVAATCNHFCFTHAKAKRDFGYEPIIGREEAIERTVADLRDRGFAKQD